MKLTLVCVLIFVSTAVCAEYIRSVNIVCPFETFLTAGYISELQRQLKNYDIGSKCIKPEEIAADRFTIVVFENGRDYEVESLKKISGADDNMIILMKVVLKGHRAFHPNHGRKVKASFRIDYLFDANGLSCEHDTNQTVYKEVSNIVKA